MECNCNGFNCSMVHRLGVGRMAKRKKKRPLYGCDNKETINKCLQCQKEECDNCLDSKYIEKA